MIFSDRPNQSQASVPSKALYAGRIINQAVRIAIWVALGIRVGRLTTAALLDPIARLSPVCVLSGLLIVTAIPAPAHHDPAPPPSRQALSRACLDGHDPLAPARLTVA